MPYPPGDGSVTRGRRVPVFTVNLFKRNFGGAMLLPTVTLRPTLMSYTAMGGCDRATVIAAGREAALWELTDCLRCPIEILDQDGVVVWWGYVARADLDVGALKLGVSVDSMANRVAVAYAYQASGVSGASSRATTEWAEFAESIAEFGTFERLESLSDAGDLEAEARRDALLEAFKWPNPEIEFGGRGLSATLECRGWFHALRRRYYANALVVDVETTEQIEDIIADVGSEFFTGCLIETDSGILTNEYRDGDSNAWSIIEDLLASGVDGESTRLLCEVTQSRVLRVYQEPAAGTGDARLYTNGDMTDAYGAPIRISPRLVGIHARLVDAIPPYVNLARVADPTRVFLERAEYDVERARLRPEARGRSAYHLGVEPG